MSGVSDRARGSVHSDDMAASKRSRAVEKHPDEDIKSPAQQNDSGNRPIADRFGVPLLIGAAILLRLLVGLHSYSGEPHRSRNSGNSGERHVS